MDNFKDFWNQFRGAILILITGLDKLILAIVVIALGAFIGNYVQRNKEDVKAKLKNFIDKM